jgi:hypothetical protein
VNKLLLKIFNLLFSILEVDTRNIEADMFGILGQKLFLADVCRTWKVCPYADVSPNIFAEVICKQICLANKSRLFD